MPEPERLAVLDDALLDLDLIPLLCPFIIGSTTVEQDYNTIVGRVLLIATITAQGSVINVGETFTVNVSVRNCSGHEITEAVLRPRATVFASVTSPTTVNLGTMAPNASVVVAVQCVANAVTPAGAPADAIINLTFQGRPQISGFKTQAVTSEISPN